MTGRTLAIVGHGPGLAGAGLGPSIDAADDVCRQANCAWQDVADYGVKWTIGGLAGPMRRALSDLSQAPADRAPGEWWLHDPRGSFVGPQVLLWTGECDNAVRAAVYRTEDWRLRAEALGATCRRGRIGLLHGTCLAIHAAESRRWASILMVGHDALAAGGEGDGPQYPRALIAAYRPDHPNHAVDAQGRPACGTGWAHDHAVERRLIDVLAAETGVAIAFVSPPA